LFEKKLRERERENRKRGSVGGKEEGQGVFGKTALSFPFLGPEQRRGERQLWGDRPAAIAGEPSHRSGQEVGEMKRATRETDSHPHLELGRREEVDRRAAADW
jgi:hypothetical protein